MVEVELGVSLYVTELAEQIRDLVPDHSGALTVVVLLGGAASERPVSLVSGRSAGHALLARGHRVIFFDPATASKLEAEGSVREDELDAAFGPAPSAELRMEDPDPAEAEARVRRLVPALTALGTLQVDVALSVLHGGAGEGGIVPGILELLGIPLVGSDWTSSAVSMDKGYAKSVLSGAGVPVAAEFAWIIDENEAVSGRPTDAEIAALGGYPVVVKPWAEGSTFGITIVEAENDWSKAAATVRPYAHPSRGAMVERYIPGRELTAAVLLDVALPIVEICPVEGFYDFEHKYTSGASDYKVPAVLPGPLTGQIQEWARRAYRALGCRDLARVDFRLAEDGEIACLELNTLPGMTSTSLFPMAAMAVGIDFAELLDILCRTAAQRGREWGGER